MVTPINFISSPVAAPASHCVGRGLTTPEELAATTAAPCRESIVQSLRRQLFSRFHFLRSTPFRLGMLFWFLFTACFGLGLFGFYQTLQERMLDSIDTSITERFNDVEAVYETNGLVAVIQLAEAKSSSPMASTMGFHLSNTIGDRIAGNIPVCITELGWDVVIGADLGLENDSSSYRFLTRSIGDNVLSLGKSLDDLLELRHIALMCVLWTLAISTALAFGVAYLVAQRMKCRANEVSSALYKVAAGDLIARLPVSSAGDDIDDMSEKINGSLDRLQLTVDSMRQVSTDIAHDLKTPLNRLFITIEEAATKSRAGRCVGNDLEGALDEAQAINGTFEALLRIAQIEAGARKSQFKSIDLKEILETAAEVYGPVVEENAQSLSVTVTAGKNRSSLPMFGDRDLLIQLVVNLVENSVNHCHAGTHISITGGEDDGTLWLCIADTGPGIPEHETEKVFQRLYRLQHSRTTKGTGLGLSLVRAIAELHCGSVTLEDNKPGLATFIRFNRNCPYEQ